MVLTDPRSKSSKENQVTLFPFTHPIQHSNSNRKEPSFHHHCTNNPMMFGSSNIGSMIHENDAFVVGTQTKSHRATVSSSPSSKNSPTKMKQNHQQLFGESSKQAVDAAHYRDQYDLFGVDPSNNIPDFAQWGGDDEEEAVSVPDTVDFAPEDAFDPSTAFSNNTTDALWNTLSTTGTTTTKNYNTNTIAEECVSPADQGPSMGRESLLVHIGHSDVFCSGSSNANCKNFSSSWQETSATELCWDTSEPTDDSREDDAPYGPSPALVPMNHCNSNNSDTIPSEELWANNEIDLVTSSNFMDGAPETITGKEKEPFLSPPRAHVLMLETKLGLNRTQVQNQQRASSLFAARHVQFEAIDGSDPENKELRNELFKLSELRGVYPQFFLVATKAKTTANDSNNNDDNDNGPVISFLGDWETIEGINDSSSLPTELLEANPTLLTWDRIPGLIQNSKQHQ